MTKTDFFNESTALKEDKIRIIIAKVESFHEINLTGAEFDS